MRVKSATELAPYKSLVIAQTSKYSVNCSPNVMAVLFTSNVYYEIFALAFFFNHGHGRIHY